MARTIYKTYDLHNTIENKDIKSPLFSWDELIVYLKENEHLRFPETNESELGSPLLHSGLPMSAYKTDGAFREKLQGLKGFYKGNNINI